MADINNEVIDLERITKALVDDGKITPAELRQLAQQIVAACEIAEQSNPDGHLTIQ